MPPPLIRAVVTDLDGTIIGPGGTVSAATAAAVRNLRQAGIPLVIATARTPAGIGVLGSLLADVTMAVCCNGAIGVAPDRGDVLWHDWLRPDVLSDIAALLADQLPDARFGGYDGRSWTVVPGYLGVRSWRPAGPVQVASAARLCALPACALGICHPVVTAAQIAAVIDAAGIVRGRATMSYGSDDTLDVVPPGTDKGSGVRRALATLGVDPADTIGFGDAMNDLATFAVVGHRVAVANAAAEVLAAADEVTGAVTDDGVAAWLSAALPAVSTPAPDAARVPTSPLPTTSAW